MPVTSPAHLPLPIRIRTHGLCTFVFKGRLLKRRLAAAHQTKINMFMSQPEAGTVPADPISFNIHPLANLLPEMTEQEYADLKTSIAKDGLLQPLVIADGMVLDGRHRQRACLELGLSLRTTTLPDNIDPADYVVAANLARRHLTTAQRAASAAEICDYRLKQKQQTGPVANLPQAQERTREQVASEFKVSGRSVQDAMTVKREDPEAFKEIKKGKLSVNAAVKRLPKRKPSNQSVVKKSRNPETKEFVVLVRDGSKPERKEFFDKKSYPNAVLFHIWPEGTCCMKNKGGNDYEMLFTVSYSKAHTFGESVIIKSSYRFVSVTIHGTVPKMKEPLCDGMEFKILRTAIEKAWPAALKFSVGLSARENWTAK